jgi:hypothetical protein
MKVEGVKKAGSAASATEKPKAGPDGRRRVPAILRTGERSRRDSVSISLEALRADIDAALHWLATGEEWQELRAAQAGAKPAAPAAASPEAARAAAAYGRAREAADAIDRRHSLIAVPELEGREKDEKRLKLAKWRLDVLERRGVEAVEIPPHADALDAIEAAARRAAPDMKPPKLKPPKRSL